jgi:hypothetical protein
MKAYYYNFKAMEQNVLRVLGHCACSQGLLMLGVTERQWVRNGSPLLCQLIEAHPATGLVMSADLTATRVTLTQNISHKLVNCDLVTIIKSYRSLLQLHAE